MSWGNLVVASAASNFDPSAQYSERLLMELCHAHEALQKAMSRLGALTHGPLPTNNCVVEARWQISRASLSRRMLWGRIHTHLSTRASPKTANALKKLQESDMALLRASSQHVGKWTIEAVLSDWEGYAPASRDIRWKMSSAISLEKRLLYPLLED